MRVALITTGKTELRGLPPALERLFPDHEFIGVEDVPVRAGFAPGIVATARSGSAPARTASSIPRVICNG